MDVIIGEASPSEKSDQDLAADQDVIDQEGDVILRSGVRNFQVSSKILTLASSVFERMFKSKFAEGHALQSSTTPLSVNLHEDNPEALAVLLDSIHFSKKRKHFYLDVDMQYDVAILADKYDCADALNSHVHRWLTSMDLQDQPTPSLWKLAAVAYLMGHQMQFIEQTRQLVQVLSAADLSAPLPLPCLPDALRGW